MGGRAMRHQCPCAVRLLTFFANGEYKLDQTSLSLKSHPGCCDVVYTPLVCFQHPKSDSEHLNIISNYVLPALGH